MGNPGKIKAKKLHQQNQRQAAKDRIELLKNAAERMDTEAKDTITSFQNILINSLNQNLRIDWAALEKKKHLENFASKKKNLF